MLLVIALGGNALMRRGEAPTADLQRHNAADAVKALVPLARDNDLVITHGNGPQVGLLALQAASYRDVPAYPLDVLGAESEGMIGYMLEQELAAALPGREVAALLTQVEVSTSDPAFSHPTKPIGPVYSAQDARRVSAVTGWKIGREGSAYRRLVPSPLPRRIIEMNAVRRLIASGVIVVCAGGGGIPVVSDYAGRLHGVEAVVDKDLATALLAVGLDADALLLLTDVDAVYTDWGRPTAAPVAGLRPVDTRGLRLDAGSMGPKVSAASQFAEATGRPAYIGSVDSAVDVLDGRGGTRIALDEEVVRRPRADRL